MSYSNHLPYYLPNKKSGLPFSNASFYTLISTSYWLTWYVQIKTKIFIFHSPNGSAFGIVLPVVYVN